MRDGEVGRKGGAAHDVIDWQLVEGAVEAFAGIESALMIEWLLGAKLVREQDGLRFILGVETLVLDLGRLTSWPAAWGEVTYLISSNRARFSL